MDAKAASAILQRYLEGDATPDEIILVEQWDGHLDDAGEWQWGEGEKERLEASMEARLLARIEAGRGEKGKGGAVVVRRMNVRRMVMRWVAAAVVLEVIVGGYLLFGSRMKGLAPVAVRYR